MLIAVVATRHEETTVGQLVKDLLSHVDAVFVADESDNPLTSSAAIRAGAEVIDCSGGIGPSLLDGFMAALNAGAERVIQIDAGGSHSVGDLATLLASHADLVIGSRFLPDSVYIGRPYRALLSEAYGAWCSIRYSHHIHDWTSGYRVWDASTLNHLVDLEYRATMHAFQAEILAKTVAMWATVEEVPITYRAARSSMSLSVAWEAVKVAL